MKKIFLSTAIALSVFSMNSCERSFEEINTDTSKIKQPSVGSFLVPIQYEMGSYGYNRADDFTFDIMQVALDFPNEGNTVSRYYLTESTGNGYWNTSYKWLKQVKELNEAAKKEQNNNYLAISKVLNAWIMANLTDAFGDVPMTEALRLEENIMKPKYDKQKDIYLSLLNDLKEANTLFDTTKTLTEGDLFFQANASTAGIIKWKKFCNSLSLRLLTRILNKNGEVDVHARINEIISNPTVYPIFQSNADGATLDISGIAPLMPPIARPQDFTAYRASGGFFTQTLVDNNDPRLSMFFTQAKSLPPANANIGYKGVPSGYALGSTFDYQPSNLNQNLAKAPLKILVMPYAELQFILSELAFKGIIPGSAQTFYESGVKATLEQWGATMPANYFANPKVAYNGTLERIMLQKYVGLFFVDHQQWYEQRRTGFPVLPNNGGLMNNAKMPQRMPYPTVTKVQNYDNYVTASQNMGGDNINTKMWWNQ
ncbi:SusD/RagB family nutrient-binding outer membrane lipoprotein [Chryseobacterium indoltheticum]|uniref:Starch-binding associating with outer membrane n=1 Tax=Chryseobacterium indoltheticum TaxID=254 RepID=A0A381FB49_9FLAO|nr:SusD/RagB family nutrient-binding outer membrane lipoprotein [Chryseobacterium indoltheticum]AZA73642.1 SusD/RagB family nutrient-binding outer membrane lipoprotein [Chryseobacterium indoltheticum]QQQ29806.1 SusD/RagB family nutrient-binding outer membrane lipoprotein [Chryseobacterium indoltheticum]SIR22011.1 Starch-binding associating with outer membrane [Chryseobacterium indoltheticum]SUX43673.1 Starch-binding associating with outer membrane [Chryseobacterium indoltheticum]